MKSKRGSERSFLSCSIVAKTLINATQSFTLSKMSGKRNLKAAEIRAYNYKDSMPGWRISDGYKLRSL